MLSSKIILILKFKTIPRASLIMALVSKSMTNLDFATFEPYNSILCVRIFLKT